MPPDNAAPVAPGADVAFPENGPILNTDIGRSSDTEFILTEAGTYQILFNASITEAGQLVLTQNGTELPYTLVGRATGTSEIVGISLVAANAGDVITVRNPAANAEALTVTPTAGGTEAVSASLVIVRLA